MVCKGVTSYVILGSVLFASLAAASGCESSGDGFSAGDSRFPSETEIGADIVLADLEGHVPPLVQSRKAGPISGVAHERKDVPLVFLQSGFKPGFAQGSDGSRKTQQRRTDWTVWTRHRRLSLT